MSAHWRRKFSIFAAVGIVNLLVFCWYYGKWDRASWSVPVEYAGDSLAIMANIKAGMEEGILPFGSKEIRHLNAPFTATRGDYPLSEDLMFTVWSGMAWILGLGGGANMAVLLAHLLAGWAFLALMQRRGVDNVVGACLAALYAASPFIWWRGLGHLIFSYYWHLPLLFLTLELAASATGMLQRGRNWKFGVMVVVIAGLQSVYYAFLFGQLIGFIFLIHLLNGRRQQARLVFELGLILTITLLVMNLDSIVYQAANGRNSAAAARSLIGLQIYAFSLPELFLPVRHSLALLEEGAHTFYYKPILPSGESASVYLGWAGTLGLGGLVIVSLVRMARQQWVRVPAAFWMALWITFYSVAGGINLLVGTFGFQKIRGTNRYSIFLLTLGLFWLAEWMSRWPSVTWRRTAAVALLGIGLWDQTGGHRSPADRERIAQQWNSDREFAKAVESASASRSLLFQIPRQPFPESNPIRGMADYEQFRPYLHAKDRFFSYGGMKGRPDSVWQEDMDSQPAQAQVRQLELFGFSGIVVNRTGLPAHGEQLERELTEAGATRAEQSHDGELVHFQLKPASAIVKPVVPEFWVKRWYGFVEGNDDRWFKGNGKWTVGSSRPDGTVVEFEFVLRTPRAQKLIFWIGKKRVLEYAGKANEVETVRFREVLPRGETVLRVATDAQPAPVKGMDVGAVTFGVSKLRMRLPL